MVAEILDWARAEPQRRTELASDITSRFAANRSAPGPTVDIVMNVNGKPMTVTFFGLSELVKPALIEVIREQLEKPVEKAIAASAQFDAIRGTPEFQKLVKESIDGTIEKTADAAFEAVERGLRDHSINVDANAKT
ncbi:MAG: hypothetical protein JJE04_23935 [Acidobacteriia bacterium]|nr:hypothetical protein [Terriglobia bacterium]